MSTHLNLERGSPDLRAWCDDHGVEFEIIHISSHADAHDLKRLVEALQPKRLIPIHTLAPDRYQDLGPNTAPLNDGSWMKISGSHVEIASPRVGERYFRERE